MEMIARAAHADDNEDLQFQFSMAEGFEGEESLNKMRNEITIITQACAQVGVNVEIELDSEAGTGEIKFVDGR